MHNHIVHVHRDREFLLESVDEYFRSGWQRGEAAIAIARPELRASLQAKFAGERMQLLDAEETLARFMVGGMPDWARFRQVIGRTIADARLAAPAGVRAYGEMVDVLWQRGERDAAIRLEEYWNDLAGLQTFSLFCAYHLDSLEAAGHDGSLERISKVHTQLIPARDHSCIDAAVSEASRELLKDPLAEILRALAGADGYAGRVPTGHATLLWLRRNMPRTADEVLARAQARLAVDPPEGA